MKAGRTMLVSALTVAMGLAACSKKTLKEEPGAGRTAFGETAKERTTGDIRNDGGPQLRMFAFTERPGQDKSGPILLQVYIVNESPALLGILNDLNSINVPQGLQPGSDAVHIDFGVSGSATFIQVGSGECAKITLLLREEQLALLERAKGMTAAVKFRGGGNDKGDVTTVLLPAVVYMTNP